MESQNSKYKKIVLQNLQRKAQPQFGHLSQQELVREFGEYNQDWGKKMPKIDQVEVHCYRDTGVEGSRKSNPSNNFFNAFLYSYNNHGDLLLVPDDIWIMILLYLSQYIGLNAQKLKHQFVKNESQSKLIIQSAKSFERVGTILKKFVDTYDDKPDVTWWNSIMTTEQEMGMSGVRGGTYIEGWILHFFGMCGRTHINEISNVVIKVPIKLIDKASQIEKDVEVNVDWISVSKVSDYLYKPDIGVCIISSKQL